MAYMGVHVTLHPPRNKSSFTAAFVLCAIVGAILIGFQGYRNQQAQYNLNAQLGKIQSNTSPRGNVFLKFVSNINEPPLAINRQLAFNLHYSNSGNVAVQTSHDCGKILIGSQNTFDQLVSEFTKWRASVQGQRGTMAPGQQTFITALGPVLTDQLYDDLRTGKKALYIFESQEYEDETGKYEVRNCRHLQQPSPGEELVFHDCAYGGSSIITSKN